MGSLRDRSLRSFLFDHSPRLVAALANGIRYHKLCGESLVYSGSEQAGACLRESVVQSDVLAYMPWFHRTHHDILTDAMRMQLLAMPVVALLFFPIMTTTFGRERRAALLEMMKIQSLDLGVYWVANYIWFFGVSMSLSLLYFLFFYLTADELDWGNLVLVITLWHHAQVGGRLAKIVDPQFEKRVTNISGVRR